METREYYPCRVLLNGESRLVAWYTNDIDGFLRDSAGRLVVVEDVAAFGVRLEEAEPADYDFDGIRSWCASPDVAMVDCSAILNAWNFLDDLARLHVGGDGPYVRVSREAATVYDKLFWGDNLAAVTPPGERYIPVWSPEELLTIRGVLEAGLPVLELELAGAVHEKSRRAVSDSDQR